MPSLKYESRHDRRERETSTGPPIGGLRRRTAGGVGARSGGACLALWTQGAILSEYARAKRARLPAPVLALDGSPPVHRSPIWMLRPASRPPDRPVIVGRLSESDLESFADRVQVRHSDRFVGSDPEREPDPLLVAWCALIALRFSGDGHTFFTGTYSDPYGESHGLMHSRNVIRDFRRFLKDAGLDDRDWVCAVEKNPSGRLILHCHCLIAGAGAFHERCRLEALWRSTGRGRLVTAAPLLDAGVGYCAKYALKSLNAADFDWSW